MDNSEQSLITKTVRTQLIPLEGMQMVLPNTCVAEIINYKQPESIKKSPDWLHGLIDWRGIRIPLISFESMNGVTAGKQQKSSRIIVVNGINGNDEMSFYGILSQGIPKLVTLKQETISTIEKPATKLPLSIQQTTINDQIAVIPDQDKIEKKLIKQGLVVTS